MQYVKTIILAAFAVLGLSASALAADFPVRPIRIILPYPAGGSTDSTARVIAQKLSERIGQSVIIENRPGGATVIGTVAVAKSAPDGYTLLYGAPATVLAPHLTKTTSFNLKTDLVPVVITTNSSLIIASSALYPAKTLKEMIDDAKARPGQVNIGMAGFGGSTHLAAALFAKQANIDLKFVPFAGNAPAQMSLARNDIQIAFDSFVSSMALLQDGKIRVLAVTTANRSPLFPDIPTVAESGLPGFDVGGWNGVFAPAGTPADIVEKLNTEFNAVLALPDVKARLLTMDYVPVGGDAKAMADFTSKEDARWSAFIKEAGIEPQ